MLLDNARLFFGVRGCTRHSTLSLFYRLLLLITHFIYRFQLYCYRGKLHCSQPSQHGHLELEIRFFASQHKVAIRHFHHILWLFKPFRIFTRYLVKLTHRNV
jgi:hypothetical protein